MSYVESDVCGTRSRGDRLAVAREQEELNGRDVVRQPIGLELVLSLVQGRQVGRVEECLGLLLEGEQEGIGDDRLHGWEREDQLCRCVDACASRCTARTLDNAEIQMDNTHYSASCSALYVALFLRISTASISGDWSLPLRS